MISLFGKVQLAVVDCLSGGSLVSSKWPFVFGSGAAECVLSGSDVRELHCQITQGSAGSFTITAFTDADFFLNGLSERDVRIKKGTEYSLAIGSSMLLFRVCRDPEKWISQIDTGRWQVQDQQGRRIAGDWAAGEVATALGEKEWGWDMMLAPIGSKAGFAIDFARGIFQGLFGQSQAFGYSQAEEIFAPVSQGKHSCPSCWSRFDTGEVKHVASHESLRGDDVLGPSEMKRFMAVKFDGEGRALDPMGIPAGTLACPHCHHPLPPNFLEVEQHIISIAGAPTAGKSYYLTVLTHQLKRVLARHFNITFIDADPTLNASLTDMRNRLFGSFTPEQAYLQKTQLEGDTYRTVLRHGVEVKLPRPFVFNLNRNDGGAAVAESLIFYDNAGEHFEPGIDHTRSPGAEHLAASSGIIFLFDPTANRYFRGALTDHEDPQLQLSGVGDQQDTLLAEMLHRLRRIKGLGAKEKVTTPLAVVVGKFDVWGSLLGEQLPADPLVTDPRSHFSLDAVDSNSKIVRDLLQRIFPEIVQYAEAISHDVKFFPATSFGHSPVRFHAVQNASSSDAAGGGIEDNFYIGPDPKKMNPYLVEAPLLWILSRIEPRLLPLKHG